LSASDLYDALEPKLNAGEVELLDHGKLQEQLLTLVRKGGRTDHLSGDHDAFANATAGAIWSVSDQSQRIPIVAPFVYSVSRSMPGGARGFDNPAVRTGALDTSGSATNPALSNFPWAR
jgi:hypothetical protein